MLDSVYISIMEIMCTYILSKNDPLIIGNQQFSSRLMLGTGKYKNFQENFW